MKMPSRAAQPGELRQDEDFTTALYRAAVGPVNTAYYLSIFTTWESSSPWKPKWNSAAGLWTLGWLVFRKMGGAALAYIGALAGSALIVFGIGRLFFNFSETGLITMFLLLLLIAVLVPGLWGNVWFHSHCRKRMAVALAAHTEVAQSCATLARQSSQPRRAMAVGTVQLGLLVALGLGVVQFSSLMQHGGFKLAGASNTINTTPQMASGKVNDMPIAAASAAVAVASPAKPTASAAVSAAAPATPPSAVAITAASKAPAASPPAAPVSVPGKNRVAEPAKAAMRPVSVVATPLAAAGRYGVNVGLFANAANAQSTQAKLEAAQLPTRVDTLKMKRGPRTRIRVGPFATQAQAQEAAVKVRSLGLEALPYQE